jgi:hypothetical protein
MMTTDSFGASVQTAGADAEADIIVDMVGRFEGRRKMRERGRQKEGVFNVAMSGFGK